MTPPADRRPERSEGPRRSGTTGRRPSGPRATTARRLAIEALVSVEDGARANVVVPAMLGTSGLDIRDRGLVTELVYGTCRMRRSCDWLVDRHLRGRTDPEVRAGLRIGAYQLAYLGTPAHAAVAATVEEVRGPGRGVVNAVLRKVAAEVAGGPIRWPDPATQLSYPDWIVARLARDLGPGPARAALEAMNAPAAATVRADGYIQDTASQWVAAAVGARHGETVIDLCAAPGGKATSMAYGPSGPVPPPPGPVPPQGPVPPGPPGEEEAPSPHDAASPHEATSPTEGGRPALVVAADSDRERARVVAGNVRRLALANVATVVADGTAMPLRPGSADRVLVDAPCSGMGVLRRRPDARWRLRPEDVDRLAVLQRRLLEAAAALVGPGGVVAYSVCTLTTAETVEIDRWLSERHPELVPLAPPGAPWITTGRGGLLLPQAAATDGMYLLRLARRS